MFWGWIPQRPRCGSGVVYTGDCTGTGTSPQRAVICAEASTDLGFKGSTVPKKGTVERRKEERVEPEGNVAIVAGSSRTLLQERGLPKG